MIFWQFFPLPFEAKNENYPTQQNIIQPIVSEKPLPAGASLYQGILLTKKDLKEILESAFDTYGISDQLPMAEKVIFCESSFNIHADNGISYGIAQFTPATWKDFGTGDIMNPYWQLRTLALMWSRGLQNRWDCYRMINK